jgi:hypothetical protein
MNQMDKAKQIILCDLDGTLANIEHRKFLIEKRTCVANPEHAFNISSTVCDQCGESLAAIPDWPAFFKACADDTPLQTTINAINALYIGMRVSGVHAEIWIASGRSGEVLEETVEWLKEHIGQVDHLLMRKEGDYTPDDELKKSWLDKGIIPKERIFCVFEDRDRVVQMWRNEGLTCYQVAPGDF